MSPRPLKAAAPASKTVYILGAGFSYPAGAPGQSELLQRIFALRSTERAFVAARDRLEHFLRVDLGIRGALSSLILEDVFTPIDRCIADGLSLRGKSAQDLREVRSDLEYVISIAIDQEVRSRGRAAQAYIEEFAKHLVRVAYHRSVLAKKTGSVREARAYDPFSIISLNWDMILDRCIHEQLEVRDGSVSGYEPIGVVDYCCYVSAFDENDGRIQPGLWALGAKGYNVKLLKLHGSMNWLQCSNCQRIFVKYDQGKMNIRAHFRGQKCRYCAARDVPATLRGALVMPTFLKDLSSFQIKVIWQNAAVELLEARRIVFIGYSLPHADFEFRQLLGRMVHPEAEIVVVSRRNRRKKVDTEYKEACLRYKQFFAGRKIKFNPHGVKAFVSSLGAMRRRPHRRVSAP